ncbi:MAG TPA: hypothetical protein VHW09_28245 [Bryobacteraceae bacterium]|jgi:hypothetical protein|nr:hypothetical protein [Bryobacteraceae bacterium]
MTFRTLPLGAILCLAAAAQRQTGTQNSKSTQSAETQAVRGCVDQQGEHYVLRDLQTSQLVTLKTPAGNPDEEFARYVGHQAQANGSLSAGTMTVTSMHQTADMCPALK